jgi:hypothetical protein
MKKNQNVKNLKLVFGKLEVNWLKFRILLVLGYKNYFQTKNNKILKTDPKTPSIFQ